MANLVYIIFHLLDESGCFEVNHDLTAHVEAVHAYIHTSGLGDCTVVVEDVDRGQVVLVAEHVVINVVGRCHLQTACTELHLDIFVHDNRHGATNEGHDNLLALEPLIAFVVGVDTDSGVTEDSLRARCGHDDVAVVTLHLVTQVVELAMFLLIYNLLVGKSGESLGVPVDHAHPTVDESFLIEVAEDADHALGTGLVHCERGAFPIARSTELAELLENNAAVLVGPVPCVTQELLAGERVLLDTLLCQFSHDLGLGRYGCMVGTGHPACVLAGHACAANEDVLDCIVEHVTHMEHAGNVRRRNHDSIRFAVIGNGVEQSVLHPISVPFVLNVLRVVFCR